MERNITDKEKTEVVATDSTGNVNAPVKEVAPAVKPEVKPAEKPEQITEPAEKPVEKPAEKPSVQPAALADRPATQRESVTQPVKLTLTAADQAKELPEFTEADTVNYVMDGDMTVHVLKSGETITVLALKYYGSKKLWPYIVKYNNITDAGKLQPGARIRIPVLRNR
jgi:nucleoid-associated protein YgaU